MGRRGIGAGLRGLVVWTGLAGLGLAGVGLAAPAVADCEDQFRHGAPSLAAAGHDRITLCYDLPDGTNVFAVHYDKARYLPVWAAYHLTRADVRAVERLDLPRDGLDFSPDGEIPASDWSLPADGDYDGLSNIDGEPYQRGHLVPAKSLSWRVDALEASFTTANLMLQDAGLNQGDWRSLEAYVRTWACLYGDVYVVTGTIHGPGAVGPHRHEDGPAIAVPTQVYKVVYTHAAGGRAIGFLFDNVAYETALAPEDAIRPIDEIEAQAGIELFPELSAARAARLEGQTAAEAHWPMTARTCGDVDRAVVAQ